MMSLPLRHSSAVSPLFGRRDSRRVAVLLFVLSTFLALLTSPTYGQASGLSVSNLTFGSSQNTIIELGGATPAPLGQTVGVGYHDWIRVGNNWSWSGSPRFSVSTFGGFEPRLGDYFDVVTWGGNRSTTTSSLIFDLPALSSTKTSWQVDFGSVSNSRLRLSVVPEPASLMLLGAAAVTTLARRRGRCRTCAASCQT